MGQTSNNGIKSFLTNLIRSFDDDFSLFVEEPRYGYEEFKNIAQIPEEALEMYRAKEESKNMRSYIDTEKITLTALQNESFEEGFFYSTERTIGKVSNNLVNSYLDCIEFLDNYISRFTFLNTCCCTPPLENVLQSFLVSIMFFMSCDLLMA